jgi:hypothetical protein
MDLPSDQAKMGSNCSTGLVVGILTIERSKVVSSKLHGRELGKRYLRVASDSLP